MILHSLIEEKKWKELNEALDDFNLIINEITTEELISILSKEIPETTRNKILNSTTNESIELLSRINSLNDDNKLVMYHYYILMYFNSNNILFRHKLEQIKIKGNDIYSNIDYLMRYNTEHKHTATYVYITESYLSIFNETQETPVRENINIAISNNSKHIFFSSALLEYKLKSTEQHIELYLKCAAESGHDTAAFMLAELYCSGTYMKFSLNNAQKYFELAADMGHKLAKFYLFLLNRGTCSPDEINAGLIILKINVENNINRNFSDHYFLGLAIQRGLYKGYSEEDGLKYLELAMNQFHLGATFLLGMHYLVKSIDRIMNKRPKNIEQESISAKCLTTVAITGSAIAQYNLGFCHQLGIGTQKNINNAISLLGRGVHEGIDSSIAIRDIVRKHISEINPLILYQALNAKYFIPLIFKQHPTTANSCEELQNNYIQYNHIILQTMNNKTAKPPYIALSKTFLSKDYKLEIKMPGGSGRSTALAYQALFCYNTGITKPIFIITLDGFQSEYILLRIIEAAEKLKEIHDFHEFDQTDLIRVESNHEYSLSSELYARTYKPESTRHLCIITVDEFIKLNNINSNLTNIFTYSLIYNLDLFTHEQQVKTSEILYRHFVTTYIENSIYKNRTYTSIYTLNRENAIAGGCISPRVIEKLEFKYSKENLKLFLENFRGFYEISTPDNVSLSQRTGVIFCLPEDLTQIANTLQALNITYSDDLHKIQNHGVLLCTSIRDTLIKSQGLSFALTLTDNITKHDLHIINKALSTTNRSLNKKSIIYLLENADTSNLENTVDNEIITKSSNTYREYFRERYQQELKLPPINHKKRKYSA